MPIALIIPTLNEAGALPRLFEAVREGGDDPECIVVADCGSDDGTVGVAEGLGAKVVDGPGLVSRATAMNAGAAEAVRLDPRVEVFWFLHADTWPLAGWRGAIGATLGEGGGGRVAGGAFTHRFDLAGVESSWQRFCLKTVSFFNRGRYYTTGSFFGDQGLFMRRDAFERVRGFNERLPLLEDLDLCRRLRRLGRVRLAVDGARVITSPRRFLRHGITRQAVMDCGILTAFNLGVRPGRIYEWYNRQKG